mgnify:FL=1
MDDLLASDAPLSIEQRQVLIEILNTMIPQAGDRPGAGDAAIVDDIVATGQSQLSAFKGLIRMAGDVGIEKLETMRSYEIRTVMSIVAQCYYRDERVMASIGMEARPPHPEGHAVEQGDWSLLDPVRARGPIYRET